MYSIFNTKIKKCSHLEEGEPPPKRLITEEDILIKELAENQLKTNLTLTEQLSKKKEFTSSETFTNISSYVSGKTDLKDFETTIADVNDLNNLKSKGLSHKDVEIYKDYANLGSEFWVKYKKINEDVLHERINDIKAVISSADDSSYWAPVSSTLLSEKEYLNSLNPSTSKTKQVTLAADGESKKDYKPDPMDELPNLEKQFIENIKDYSSVDIKKIRKKARSMGNKIKNLEDTGNVVSISEQSVIKNQYLQRQTQWDVKEKPINIQRVEIINKDKVYGCKPPNWYAIKDGKIMKLDENRALPKTENAPKDTAKLTLEDIKNIPKFSNYDPGMPSKVLFLKNLKKNITENCLRDLLKQFEEQCYSVKVMSGKMIGQAFIDFKNVSQASEALEILNGVVLEGKPIIVEYGKRNT